MSCGGFVEGDFGWGAGLDDDGTAGVGTDSLVAGGGVGVGDEGGRVCLSSGEGHGVRDKGRVAEMGSYVRAGPDAHSFQEKERRLSRGWKTGLLAQVVSMKRCWQLLEGYLQEHVPAPKNTISVYQ